MKIVCPRDGLLTACQLVSAAVAARTTKPILSNVKATAADDGLTLVAFDTEVGIRYDLRGIQVSKAGEAILAVLRFAEQAEIEQARPLAQVEQLLEFGLISADVGEAIAEGR